MLRYHSSVNKCPDFVSSCWVSDDWHTPPPQHLTPQIPHIPRVKGCVLECACLDLCPATPSSLKQIICPLQKTEPKVNPAIWNIRNMWTILYFHGWIRQLEIQIYLAEKSNWIIEAMEERQLTSKQIIHRSSLCDSCLTTSAKSITSHLVQFYGLNPLESVLRIFSPKIPNTVVHADVKTTLVKLMGLCRRKRGNQEIFVTENKQTSLFHFKILIFEHFPQTWQNTRRKKLPPLWLKIICLLTLAEIMK